MNAPSVRSRLADKQKPPASGSAPTWCLPGSPEHRALWLLSLAERQMSTSELVDALQLTAWKTSESLVLGMLKPMTERGLVTRIRRHAWQCTFDGATQARVLGPPMGAPKASQDQALHLERPPEARSSMFRRAMGNGDQRSPVARPGSLDAGRLPSLICGRRVWPSDAPQ